MRYPPCLRGLRIRIYRASKGWPSDGAQTPGIETFDSFVERKIGLVRTMDRMIYETAAANVARETGFAALSRFGTVLVSSVRSHFKRAAIERELSRLDNRMLADLGLGRSEIGFIAEQAVAVPGEGT